MALHAGGMTIDVWLQCPACSYRWHAAEIDRDAWWGNVKPEMTWAGLRLSLAIVWRAGLLVVVGWLLRWAVQ